MLGTTKDKEYFKKYLTKLSTSELLALMQAITEFGLEMANVTGKITLPGKKGNNFDVT
jgi:hypothetical protein